MSTVPFDPRPLDPIPSRVLELLERVPADNESQHAAFLVMDWYIIHAAGAGGPAAVGSLASLRAELLEKLTQIVEGGVS